MAIDAVVDYVNHEEDDSGCLVLCDRAPSESNPTPGLKGQARLYYSKAPHEVTALNGLEIWGNLASIVLGDCVIAHRLNYSRIEFVDRESFLAAVSRYHARRRGEVVK